jgi:hypothetical protein
MEPARLLGTVRRLCSSDIFLRNPAHSRRAPPKPIISLVSYLISSVLQSIKQKKQQRRKRSFLKLQANASSLRQSKANNVSISLIGKIAVLKTI